MNAVHRWTSRELTKTFKSKSSASRWEGHTFPFKSSSSLDMYLLASSSVPLLPMGRLSGESPTGAGVQSSRPLYTYTYNVHVHTLMYRHACTCTCTCTYTYAQTCMYMYMYMYIHLCTDMHVHVHVHVHTLMHRNIIYIHTSTHIDIQCTNVYIH